MHRLTFPFALTFTETEFVLLSNYVIVLDGHRWPKNNYCFKYIKYCCFPISLWFVKFYFYQSYLNWLFIKIDICIKEQNMMIYNIKKVDLRMKDQQKKYLQNLI